MQLPLTLRDGRGDSADRPWGQPAAVENNIHAASRRADSAGQPSGHLFGKEPAVSGTGRPAGKRQGGHGGTAWQPPPFAERFLGAPAGIDYEEPDEQERTGETPDQESADIGGRTRMLQQNQRAGGCCAAD